MNELHSLINHDNGGWAFPLSLPFAGSDIYWVQDEQGQAQIFDLQRNRVISDEHVRKRIHCQVRGAVDSYGRKVRLQKEKEKQLEREEIRRNLFEFEKVLPGRK